MAEIYAPEFLNYSNGPQHPLPREVFDSFGIVLKKFLDALYVCVPEEYSRFLVVIMDSHARGDLLASIEERHAIIHQMREALENDAGRLALSNIDRNRVRIGEYEFKDYDEDLSGRLWLSEQSRLPPREWLVNAFHHAFYLSKLFLPPTAESGTVIRIYLKCRISDAYTADALYKMLRILVRGAPGTVTLWRRPK